MQGVDGAHSQMSGIAFAGKTVFVGRSGVTNTQLEDRSGKRPASDVRWHETVSRLLDWFARAATRWSIELELRQVWR
jgi:hypothetical protein